VVGVEGTGGLGSCQLVCNFDARGCVEKTTARGMEELTGNIIDEGTLYNEHTLRYELIFLSSCLSWLRDAELLQTLGSSQRQLKPKTGDKKTDP
jgi:hypothetical protein